ncbi:MAG: NADH-quinone oxidoreductase subunit H, partial [candidate division WOR-3 bacterium]|nr:NADH-quinone oxidoreductase subunit H [candidate division WOR-3 bacterium]
VVKTNGSIRIGDIVMYQQKYGPLLYSASGLIAFIVGLICIQAKLGYAPFDIAEAEQELMAGVYTEYSGAGLALFRLSKAMMLFLLPCLEITLFWGGLARWSAIPEFLLILILIILIKNTNPRLRIDQALKFFWLGLMPVAILAIILAFYNL